MDIKYFKDSKEKLMAILIPSQYKCEGINFITSDDSYQQIAFMGHKCGHTIVPHYHNTINRNIDLTTETLIIREGILEVTLYENLISCHKFEIHKGDILALISGGHGFYCKSDVDMVEIKQGPFMGATDKTRF